MKHLDQFSQRVLAVSLSIMGIILCSTLFFASVNTANANDVKNSDFPQTLGSSGAAISGTIMMDYTSVHVPSQDKTYYEVMVWDTSTGQSKLYFYDYTSKGFKAYEDNVQLPSSPLN